MIFSKTQGYDSILNFIQTSWKFERQMAQKILLSHTTMTLNELFKVIQTGFKLPTSVPPITMPTLKKYDNVYLMW